MGSSSVDSEMIRDDYWIYLIFCPVCLCTSVFLFLFLCWFDDNAVGLGLYGVALDFSLGLGDKVDSTGVRLCGYVYSHLYLLYHSSYDLSH